MKQVHSQSVYIENTENYLTKGKLPQTDFLRLNVNQSFFKQDQEDGEERDDFNLNFDNVKALEDILSDPSL